MSTNFIFTPENTETLIIKELEKGFEYNIDNNNNIVLQVNTGQGNSIKICDILECGYIRISHEDFEKMIAVYNEINKRISNEKA